jgi:hypothetical protein
VLKACFLALPYLLERMVRYAGAISYSAVDLTSLVMNVVFQVGGA